MAQKQVSLKKNFIMNALLAMSGVIFPLITAPYVLRVLHETGTGKVELALSVVTYFNMFAYLGLPTYGIRACAKVRDDKEKLSRTVHELVMINLFMTVIVYIVFGIALFTVPKMAAERPLYAIVGLNIILYALSLEWLYKALEQYSYITKRSVAFKLIALIAMFLLIHAEGDYVWYGAVAVLASSASYLLNLVNARKYIYLHNMGDYHFRKHLKPILFFFAMSVATTIYTNLDNVMLGFMKADADVGFYAAAVRIKGVLVMVVTSLGTVILPRASYYIETKQFDEFKRISSKALNFVFLLSVPLAVYFMMYAPEGIFFLGSERYLPSVVPMRIIMPTLILIGASNIMGIQILVPLGREKTVFYSEVAGAVTDLVLNAILIPRLSGTGAAIGTLCAEFVVTIWQLIALGDEIYPAYAKIRFASILLAVAAGCLCSAWVKMLSLGYFMKLLISAILFFGAYGCTLLACREPLTAELAQQLRSKLHRNA